MIYNSFWHSIALSLTKAQVMNSILSSHIPLNSMFFFFFSEDFYKNHPKFKELYTDEDGDGKIDYGKKRVFHN